PFQDASGCGIRVAGARRQQRAASRGFWIQPGRSAGLAKLLQRVLAAAAASALLVGSAPVRKFYPDDPLRREPAPLPVGKLSVVKFTDSGDFLHDTFLKPGERQSKTHPKPSLDINTVDELPDSA